MADYRKQMIEEQMKEAIKTKPIKGNLIYEDISFILGINMNILKRYGNPNKNNLSPSQNPCIYQKRPLKKIYY